RKYTSEQTAKISTFLPAMWPAFFIRVRPASRNAKPACMNITRIAVTTTQMVLAAINRLWLDTALHLLQRLACSVVHDGLDREPPDEAVAGLVAGPGRVGDRGLHLVGDLVSHQERQQRLRKEARLEDAPAVLVRDPALAPVTYR